MSGDARESGERPRRSWREIDQMRDGTRRRDEHSRPLSKVAQACRAYREALGMPSNRSLLTLFLDSDDQELVLAGLDALSGAQRQAGLEVSAGLKSQLRVLAQGFDDAVAEAAEELLERRCTPICVGCFPRLLA